MITVILCSYHGEKYIDAQRRSILNQDTEVPFKLLEYDDEVRLSGSAANNFLSAIREAPKSDYYMLSDQDDLWHPDKIDRLYHEILRIEGAHTEGAHTQSADFNGTHFKDTDFEDAHTKAVPVLVFSDARVVDESLNEISPSFVRYEGLSADRLSLSQLLIMNQVTGAACMFNYALKKLLEEHPMPCHAVVHDQWLALIAAAFGSIGYLDEALYDYRQHGENVLGAREGSALKEGAEMAMSGHRHKARKAYDALSLQAEEFLEQYRDMLSKEQQDVLSQFAGLPKLSKAERIKTVLKYGFTYNRLYRTLGELVNI